jgi:hypothetical protein
MGIAGAREILSQNSGLRRLYIFFSKNRGVDEKVFCRSNMEEGKYLPECGECKEFQLEIIDRLARIETKQDNIAGVQAAYQNELSQLYERTTAQGKEITALTQEIKNLKWLAGIVAGVVTGMIPFLSFLFKRG